MRGSKCEKPPRNWTLQKYGYHCSLITGGFLFLMSCNRAEVWQYNLTLGFPWSCNTVGTEDLLGNCQRWMWFRWWDQRVITLLMALILSWVQQQLESLYEIYLSILFQNILIIKLSQWIKNQGFESLSSHSVREGIT